MSERDTVFDTVSLSRRRFLHAGAAGLTGLVLGCRVSGNGGAGSAGAGATGAGATSVGATSVGCGEQAASGATGTALNAWLRIAPDDTVTVVIGSSEMGQGISTALPMLVAEELEVDWSTVRVEIASPTPAGTYDNPAYQTQATAGSTSMMTSFLPLRQAGATAREMLLAAAAAKFGVPASECVAQNGEISHPATNQKASYGSLAEAAAKLTPPAQVTLKKPSEWKLIGTSAPRLDTPAKVCGTAVFGIDVKVDQMLVGTVMACPTLGGKLTSVDPAPAMAVKGVQKVVQLADAVVVVADGYYAATQGLAALQPVWDPGANAGLSSDQFRQDLKTAVQQPGTPLVNVGDVATALAGAAKTVEAVYEVPFLAHAALETLNATVAIQDGGADVWVGTQAQGNLQGPVAQLLGIQPEQVRVHTTFLGGGFGRRLSNDFVLQAAAAAKAVGKPVKLIWSRQEDTSHDYYRPAAASRLRVGLDAGGALVAWECRVAAPGYVSEWLPPKFYSLMNTTPEKVAAAVAVEGAMRLAPGIQPLPYAFPAQRVEYVSKSTTVPMSFWRSIGPSYNTFFVECMLDEVAHAAGKDPLAFRLGLLASQPRHTAVLQQAATAAGWGTPPAAGRFRGLALCDAFGSIGAEVAEISIGTDNLGKKTVRVHKVTCAVDCGPVVNPNTAAAQVEGGIAFGLTAALYGEITIVNGKVQQQDFAGYKLLTAADMPEVEVHFIPSDAPIGGLGEIGTPPIAPAVANAVFAATGVRVRKLPIQL